MNRIELVIDTVANNYVTHLLVFVTTDARELVP